MSTSIHSISNDDLPLRRTGSTGQIPTPITEMALSGPIVPRSYPYSDSCTDGIDLMLSLGSTTSNDQISPASAISSTIEPAPSPASDSSPTRTISVPLAAVENTAGERPAETVLLANASGTARRRPRQSLYVKTAAFLGYGDGSPRMRRELISLIFNFLWALTQMVAIVTVVVLSTHFKSPRSSSLTEWQACGRLGVWSSIWIVRAIFSWALGYWGWVRNRKARIRADLEGSSAPSGNAASTSVPNATSERPPMRAASNPNAGTSHGSSTSADAAVVVAPPSVLLSRLTLISSVITLTWFMTAHILIYTTLNTCRHSSPHLWWLTFSILCIMYVMVLEILALGLVVFVLAPIFFLFWNIVLICLGRHPLQHAPMKHEIGKLPKSAVDRIPLVMYIPPPPDEPAKDIIRVPEPAYSYPPTTPTFPAQKRRFKWWKRDSKLKDDKGQKGEAGSEKGGENMNEKAAEGDEAKEVVVWEENWEQGEYPFVRLEGNRAACAICLMDFEEPKRIRGTPAEQGKADAGATDEEGKADSDASDEEESIEELVREISVEDVGETPDRLKLSDAGEGAQPLRLLACGHVFHKTCLDPWLEKVSGRCPVCQRPVELPHFGQKKAGRGRGRRR